MSHRRGLRVAANPETSCEVYSDASCGPVDWRVPADSLREPAAGARPGPTALWAVATRTLTLADLCRLQRPLCDNLHRLYHLVDVVARDAGATNRSSPSHGPGVPVSGGVCLALRFRSSDEARHREGIRAELGERAELVAQLLVDRLVHVSSLRRRPRPHQRRPRDAPCSRWTASPGRRRSSAY